jgi:hypothetical protein
MMGAVLTAPIAATGSTALRREGHKVMGVI